MAPQIVLEWLRQALQSGVVEARDGVVYYNGNPVLPDPEDGYRPDGWSVETDLGCRRHRAIDELLDKLEAGNETDKWVASLYPRWYCFDPMQLAGFTNMEEWRKANPPAHSIEAEDPDERKIATDAALSARWRFLQTMNRNDATLNFAVREDTDGDGRKEHRVLADYRVVFAADAPVEEIVDRFPQQQVASIERAIATLSNPGKYWY